MLKGANNQAGFTLIELLVVVSVIGLLISILIPALSAARAQAKATVCLTRLRTAGQGLVLYGLENSDTLVPGRLPKIDDDHWRARVVGGMKYRPTFLTMMESQMGIPPFDDPQPSKTSVDRFGQPGDRQNYSSELYVCPEVDEWRDERNGAFGYNYHFLGNARLADSNRLKSYKNWPVKSSWVRSPGQCVAVADSIGTAASFAPLDRTPYEDNLFGDSRSGRTVSALGNEGFNLDPPRIDTERGEMADFDDNARTALHQRHGKSGSVLWVDGHGSSETLKSLGYDVGEDGVIGFEGNNRFFNILHKDEAWIEK